MTLRNVGRTIAQGVPAASAATAAAGPGPPRLPSERPRERLLHRGAAALAEAELLSLILRTGRDGCDATGLGCELLSHFGDLAGLASAPAATLLRLPGLGPAKTASLLAALELGRRLRQRPLPAHRPLDSTASALAFVRGQIGSADRELFACLFLDSRHRPLGFEVLFKGSIDRAHVYPREIIKRALTYNAAAVILAHNHPSGSCEPSEADCRLTGQLEEILTRIDVRLLDHLVVAGEAGVSFAERGLLSRSS